MCFNLRQKLEKFWIPFFVFPLKTTKCAFFLKDGFGSEAKKGWILLFAQVLFSLWAKRRRTITPKKTNNNHFWQNVNFLLFLLKAYIPSGGETTIKCAFSFLFSQRCSYVEVSERNVFFKPAEKHLQLELTFKWSLNKCSEMWL